MGDIDFGDLTSIAELAAERVDAMEASGRCDRDVVEALRAGGWFRMLVPRSLGGAEASPSAFVDAVEELSTANASAGWCLMIAASTGSISGWMPPPAADEVFGDPGSIHGGTYAPIGAATRRGDGAWEVSGRWQWGSGSQHCTWMFGGVRCGDGSIGLAAMPAGDVTVIENWDVLGMRGTGSHDWAAESVVVPESRLVRLIDATPVESGPLYRFPLFGLLALGISAVSSGIGRAALASIADRGRAERSTFQREFGRATALHESARAWLSAVIDDAWRTASSGEDPSLEQRARLRLAAAHAVHTATDTARFAFTAGGGGSVRSSSVLQRLLRDAHVATQHVMVGPHMSEAAARPLLGLEVDPGEL